VSKAAEGTVIKTAKDEMNKKAGIKWMQITRR
jgi:hypothetical protein